MCVCVGWWVCGVIVLGGGWCVCGELVGVWSDCVGWWVGVVSWWVWSYLVDIPYSRGGGGGSRTYIFANC